MGAHGGPMGPHGGPWGPMGPWATLGSCAKVRCLKDNTEGDMNESGIRLAQEVQHSILPSSKLISVNCAWRT